MSMIKGVFISIILLYVSALLLVYIFQRDFLYFPSKTYVAPEEAKAPEGLKEISVETEDHLHLKGWYAPATTQATTIVFFHGNGDSLATAAFVATPYLKAGYGFLVAEYRGYSGMPGQPSEQGLYADARAYVKALVTKGIKLENIVLFGHSLGTGVATQMAQEFHVRALILLAPYTSIARMAKIQFPIFPAEYMTRDRFENFKKIPKINMPILFANGGRDQVIPPSQGRQLFEMAQEPKTFVFVPQAGHNDLFQSEFLNKSLQWLSDINPPTSL